MNSGEQKRVVLGTAGHIDHGKTSLVRALTGIDTDRLKEEKERGITIELGFAHLLLPSGIDLAIVDVPGHERFVKNMVAGASGIDFVLLAVAADEGVMPQTREHLEICTLLGVQTGLVALTKADTVDSEFLELARDDVETLVRGTFLEGASLIPVSSVTREGLPDLVARLDEIAQTIPQRTAKGLFRLPVDRVFTMKGFGTVVTGTAVSGSVRRDEEVEVVPRGKTGKVRGLQVHGKAVDRAYAGQRTALNLAGFDVEDIARGDTVTHPDTVEPTHMLDARLALLASATQPLGRRSRLRLHVGTQDVPALVALLEGEELRPGEIGYIQIRSREKVVACPGDRFVLRAFSPAVTVGGGVILDHQPPRHKGSEQGLLDTLEVLAGGTPEERLGAFLRVRGPRGLNPQGAQACLGVPLEEARNLLQAAVRAGQALVTDRKGQWHHHAEEVEALEEKALSILARHHQENPLRRGLGTEELRTKLPRYLNPRLIGYVLDRLEQNGLVIREGDTVRRADFTIQLSADDEGLRRQVLGVVSTREYEAPSLEEAAAAVGEDPRALRPVLEYLVERGELIRTKEGFYFQASLLSALTTEVIELLRKRGEIGVADIKELTGTTRKYTIPLLEYLDGQKITARRGDVRVAGSRGKG